MDFTWSESERALRDEVRTFFAAEWPEPPLTVHDDEAWARARALESRLAERGWPTMAWPSEYGGRAAPAVDQAIYVEEAFYAGAPQTTYGVRMAGPTFITNGTPEQQAEHLPPIVRAETVWCQGFSEPYAGSDLASLTTRAERQGDHYLVNGQKVWITFSPRADWILVLTRSDPDAPKHRGITFLFAPIDTPGISVRPLEQLNGDAGFGEVFFEDVRIPVEQRIGEEHRGWYVATTTLDFERSGVHRAAMAERLLDHLTTLDDAHLEGARRLEVADVSIAVAVGRLVSYRVAWMQGRGLIPNYEASMSKVYNSEVMQVATRLAVNALGLFGQLEPSSPRAPLGGWFAYQYLTAVSATIAGGTSEVQRNIIATRGLGLPRG